MLNAFKQTVDFHLGSTCYQAVIKIRNMEHGTWNMEHGQWTIPEHPGTRNIWNMINCNNWYNYFKKITRNEK